METKMTDLNLCLILFRWLSPLLLRQ